MNVRAGLATALGRNDERPNVELAEALAAKPDRKAIFEAAAKESLEDAKPAKKAAAAKKTAPAAEAPAADAPAAEAPAAEAPAADEQPAGTADAPAPAE